MSDNHLRVIGKKEHLTENIAILERLDPDIVYKVIILISGDREK